MSDIWFTADTHFRHRNIMKYCKRPFSTVEEMEEVFVSNWNSRIQVGDTVYHLGDFAFCKTSDEVDAIRIKLNGQIFLIWGNHDKDYVKKARGFIWQGPYKEIKIGDQNIILMHYAMRVWNKSHFGSWNLYGHSHNTLPDDPNALSLDVGVDANEYQPINYYEVAQRMSLKKFVPIDHHVGNYEE
jgi:calcineurin-like phosphoesterase family protein